MAIVEYSTFLYSFLLIFISFLFVLISLSYKSKKQNPPFPTNWPIVGMIPAALVNGHRIHDYITEILACTNGTFFGNGPWFANMDMLFTANPSDIQHILSTNFANYPKGDKFQNIFSIFGHSISNSDGDLWEFHRRTLTSVFKHPCFQSLLEKTTWDRVEEGLIPIFESVSRQGVDVDLQEVFLRFTFDAMCKLIFDYDPQSMSLDFPYIPCEKALSDMEEAVLHRHFMPPIFWKLQQLFRMGNEKKLSDAWTNLDQFIYGCITQKQKDFTNNMKYEQVDEENFNIPKALMREFNGHNNGNLGDTNKLLRDTILNLMAGRDSISSCLTWFFYLLAKNPIIENKILEELHSQLKIEGDGKWKYSHVKELSKLVYLHGAISEALRLFPSIPLNHKVPLQPDILPSGHHVDRNTTVILSFYSMGRMKSIWGEDCMEFKPERWISTGGGIKHQPFYKFPAFNAGPRTCVAKQMVMCQAKIVAATIIYRYKVELVEGHQVFPSDSIILQMKSGLKVRLTKRSELKL